MKHLALLIAIPLAAVGLVSSAALPSVWSAQELVGIADSYDDYSPEVAIDPQGRAWVIWMGFDGTDYEVYWSRWEEGAGWSARVRVNPDNTLYDAWPRLSMAPDGTPWVAWLRHRATGYYWDLLSCRWNGKGWTVPDTVVAGPGISDANYHGMVAVDSTHCWIAYDRNLEVLAKEYQEDHWGPVEQVIGGMSVDPWQVDAALGADGQPWVIWADSGVRATRRHADGSWDSPAFLDPPGGGGGPAITVDADGEAWAVWGDDSDACLPNGWPDIFFSRTIDGVWQNKGVVNLFETSDCGSDAASDVAAAYGWPPRSVWSRKYPGGAAFQYRDAFSSGWDSEGWGPQAQVNALESTFRQDSYPTLAIGPEGEAWAAWMRPTTATTQPFDIYASQLLLDVIGLGVRRTLQGVEVSWRLVGYAPRSDFLIEVMRAGDAGDTVRVGDRFYGSGDEYLIVDETASPQSRYSYWIEVLDPVGWIDPPMGAFLFRTNARVVEPLIVSVAEGPWSGRVPFTARPNPSSGDVEFQFGGASRNCVLEVFDVQGRLVWREQAAELRSSASGWQTVRWAPRTTGIAAAGVFWARLRSEEGRVLGSSKVVLVR